MLNDKDNLKRLFVQLNNRGYDNNLLNLNMDRLEYYPLYNTILSGSTEPAGPSTLLTQLLQDNDIGTAKDIASTVFPEQEVNNTVNAMIGFNKIPKNDMFNNLYDSELFDLLEDIYRG